MDTTHIMQLFVGILLFVLTGYAIGYGVGYDRGKADEHERYHRR